jgi:protein SCO1/2
VLTVSFEPKETPELARAKKENYLRRYNRPTAQAGWHFLTGDAESIRRLTSAVGFKYVWDESAHQYAHAAGIVVVTPQGRIARYFYGVEFPPKDLRLGLVEAADGKIGNLVDRVLLYCFHYDRKREVRCRGDALGARRAILILAAIAGFLIVSLRREKKHIAVVGN